MCVSFIADSHSRHIIFFRTADFFSTENAKKDYIEQGLFRVHMNTDSKKTKICTSSDIVCTAVVVEAVLFKHVLGGGSSVIW